MSPFIRISRKKPDRARSMPSDMHSHTLREIAGYVQSAGNATQRYRATGDRKALDAATSAWEQAVSHPFFEATPTDFQAGALNSAGTSFMHRYEAIGRRDDLDRALVFWGQALQRALPGSSDLPSLYNNRGNGLLARYMETGTLSDLDEAIRVLYQAVQHTPPDSSDLAGHLSSLGAALGARYDRFGRESDLQESLRLANLAVKHTSPDSPELPRRLSNLGTGRSVTYARTGRLYDLEAAIDTYRFAIRSMPSSSPDLPSVLTNLGNDLRNYYARTDQLQNLDEAIDNYRLAIHLTATGSPYSSAYLSDLGTALNQRFRRNGDVNDIREAIHVSDQAVRQTPPNSPYRPLYLNNLGLAIGARYLQSNQPTDLDDSIQFMRQAVKLSSADSPNLPGFLNNLSTALVVRYKNNSRDEDFEEARIGFRRACMAGQGVGLEIVLGSALNWAAWSLDRSDWEETVEACSFGQKAADLLFATQVSRQAKESWLKTAQGLAANAAFALAKLGRLKEAAEAIESGRAQLLAEALDQNRRNLESLSECGRGALFNRYTQVADQFRALQTAFASQSKQHLGELSLRTEMETARQELMRAIEAIRQVPGYEDFFLPPTFARIQQAAPRNAPLIYLVTTSAGGLALVVRATTLKFDFFEKSNFFPPVEAVWLDGLTETALQEAIYGSADNPALIGYLGVYEHWRRNPGNAEAQQTWFATLDRTTLWLWDVLMAPLLDHLARVPLPASRAVLVPAGLLGLLPLHTAWTEDATTPTGRRYALDTLTISYAASARALADAREIAARAAGNGMLAVDNPDGSLVFSRQEVAAVRSYFPASRSTVLQNAAATRRAVLDQLPDYPVYHFSTHGRAGWDEPLESRLFMAGGVHLTLRDLLDQCLPGARLAVLSACETGIPGTKLPDEVVSLPSGFAQAGVAGVVASLWAVNDMSTAMLMERFYRGWREDGLAPAEALRRAQIWLRDATNREMVAYFEQDVLPALTERMPAAVAADFAVSRFRFDSDARSFAHPFYWAAFTMTGV